jgi:hypothetical protein
MDNDMVAWGSMTPGEQWCMLQDVYWATAFDSDLEDAVYEAWGAHDAAPHSEVMDARKLYPEMKGMGAPPSVAHQARYDAALEYVKGVMDATNS